MDIRGKYGIYARLNGTLYTLTGNTRGATFANGSATPLVVYCMNAPSDTGKCNFPVEGILNIKRGRVTLSGAPGAFASPGKIAAKFCLKAVIDDPDNPGQYLTMDECYLKFSEYGQWLDLNAALMPFKRIGAPGTTASSVQLLIDTANSEFSVDDFNLQSEYVGQMCMPMVEFEIDAGAGICDIDNHILY